MKGKNVIVTGGLGFIGSHLVEALVEKNDVTVIDNRSTGKLENIDHLGDALSRIQRELETRDLSSIPTEKLFAMYAHFYRKAQHALPELTFRNDDEIKVARARRLPSSDDWFPELNSFSPSKKS
jgi:nucleoside-diphosphate-sugar epimerase